MKYTTERAYAVALVEGLMARGWALSLAEDGEHEEIRPKTAREAVDHVMSCEQGWVVVDHPVHNRVVLGMLFQNGAPEEVVYDYAFSTFSAEAEVESVVEMLAA